MSSMIKKTRDWLHVETERLKVHQSKCMPKPELNEYAWRATVYSQVSEAVEVYYFSTREQARKFKKAAEMAMTTPTVVVDKIPMPDEDGWLEI
jgi:hypothetical protein